MDIKVFASGSRANCYAISDGETTLMIECGNNWNSINDFYECKIGSVIRGVLLTHEHADHSKNWKKVLALGIDIFATKGTFEALGAKDNHHIRIVSHNQQFQIGTFTIVPFTTEHDSLEPIGFVIYSTITKEKLLFATDTYFIHWKFNKLNYIMIECNYQEKYLFENVENGSLPKALVPRLTESHMSLETCLDFLDNQDLTEVKKIYLLHLSDGNCNADECLNAVMAETGLPTIVAERGG